ncbi:MAG: hypothetical protein KDC98_00490, partial [Planctomycetes bacterium]|nr:hypothetical protein [Planctomycetota bacterium]
MLVLLVLTVLWNGWVCDDAFITFRVADNLLEGYGLRWNVAERVQAYSNPLWLLTFIPVYAVIGNAYAAAIVLGVTCTAVAIVLAQRLATSPALAVFGTLLCLLSKAFVDYATSGLENPLAFLLLAAVALGLLRQEPAERPSPRACFLLAMACALLMTNRLDAGLFATPVLGYLLWRRPGKKGIAAMALGGLPLLLWLAFATLYYGFPFPNTAYAKLQTGWSASALVAQGFRYVGESLQHDPITMATILIALALAWRRRSPARLALAAGVTLHLVYVIKIGGDFMSGRFLTAPFFVSVLLLATTSFEGGSRAVHWP